MKVFNTLLRGSKYSIPLIFRNNFIFSKNFNSYKFFTTANNNANANENNSCQKEHCGCHPNPKEDPLEKELKEKNYKIIEFINLGKFEEALDLSDDFISTIKTNFGDSHAFYCSALNNKAFILKTCGEFEEAKSLFEEVIEKYKKLYGENSEKVILAMHNLATTLKEAKEFEKSLEIYQKLLKIIKNEHFEVENEKTGRLRLNIIANIYNSAGGLYRQLKNYKESDSLFKDAMSIIKENYGENTLPMATVYNNIALSLKDQKKFEDSMKNYNKALEIRKELLDENHPEVISLKHNIEQLKIEMNANNKI
jgi:tetratricopeptide (TPR) repeat protein